MQGIFGVQTGARTTLPASGLVPFSASSRRTVVAGAAGVDGGGHGAVKVVGTDRLDQADRVQTLPQLQGRAGEVEFDVALAQPVDDLAQRLLGAGVDVADERPVEHDVPHRLGGAVHRGPDPALEEVGVREEEPVLDAVDDHPCGDAGIRMLDDVDVPVLGGGPAEDGVRGPGRAADDVGDRQHDGHDDRLQHSDHDDTTRR